MQQQAELAMNGSRRYQRGSILRVIQVQTRVAGLHSGANKSGLDSSGRSSARRLLPSEGSSEHQNIVAGAASSTLTVVTVKHGVDDGLGSVLKHLVLRAVLAKCLGKGTGGRGAREVGFDTGTAVLAMSRGGRGLTWQKNVPCWPARIGTWAPATQVSEHPPGP